MNEAWQCGTLLLPCCRGWRAATAEVKAAAARSLAGGPFPPRAIFSGCYIFTDYIKTARCSHLLTAYIMLRYIYIYICILVVSHDFASRCVSADCWVRTRSRLR